MAKRMSVGHLVEPAVPALAFRVRIGRERAHQAPAPEVVQDEQRDQRELRVQPAAGAAEPCQPQPQPEGEREDGARRHDAPEELALHELEALDGGPVARHRVVDEKPRQIEQAREPGHHEDDVQRLYPEHGYSEKRFLANRIAIT